MMADQNNTQLKNTNINLKLKAYILALSRLRSYPLGSRRADPSSVLVPSESHLTFWCFEAHMVR